ncbi:hypothetical protein EDB85DRAFT_1838731, partial [Lactarius pseudohatsudake]
IYSIPLFNKTPYHTSALSGEAWLLELIGGHPERMKTQLGMRLTGLSVRHVGERFQHANETISRYVSPTPHCLVDAQLNVHRYFHLILLTLSSSPLYFPFFEGALGAMDGSHFACCPSSLEHQYARDRK